MGVPLSVGVGDRSPWDPGGRVATFLDRQRRGGKAGWNVLGSVVHSAGPFLWTRGCRDEDAGKGR